MRRLIYYISSCFLLGIIFLLPGCKTAKTVGTVIAEGTKEQSVFFDSMTEQSFQFHTLSARLHVDLNIPGKDLSSRVDLKIVKDSALQLSVQPFLGIEVFRLELTPDSIKVMDRLNKRYVADDYNKQKRDTPIDFNFYNLQAIFTNHIFIPGEQGFTKKQYSRFKLEQGGSVAEARIKDKMGIEYTFTADGEEKLLRTYISGKEGEYALQWVYNDFRLQGDQAFPMLMDVRVLVGGVSEGGMKINFNRVQTDIPLNFDFSIPDKYKRITFAEIIKSLTHTQK